MVGVSGRKDSTLIFFCKNFKSNIWNLFEMDLDFSFINYLSVNNMCLLLVDFALAIFYCCLRDLQVLVCKISNYFR